MNPGQNLVTADELLRMPEIECRYEIVKGELRRYPFAGSEHGVVGIRFAVALGSFVENSFLGVVVVANTGFQIASNPDTVRAPDVAFVRQERIPEDGLPKGFWPGPPDLAVEVISPSDRYENRISSVAVVPGLSSLRVRAATLTKDSEVEEKVGQWLDAGTRMVIVIDPRTHRVVVYSSPDKAVRLAESDVIDCGDVVPGFSYPVAELFR